MPQKPLNLNIKLGLTAAATGAIYLVPGAAQATIVTMADVGGSPFSGSSASLEASPINWDLDNNGTVDFRFMGNSSYGAIAVLDLGGEGWVVATANPNQIDINNLPLSFGIGSQAGYGIGSAGIHWFQASGTFLVLEGFSDGVTAYSGFAFDIGGNTHYGWLEWTHTLATHPGEGLVEVTNWAFEDSADTPIQVGATSSASVPEPGSLALLAAGAGGLLAWRRRRGAVRPVAA